MGIKFQNLASAKLQRYEDGLISVICHLKFFMPQIWPSEINSHSESGDLEL